MTVADTSPTLPLSEADELRLQVDALLAEVVPLREVAAAAEYVSGPSGCVEDRDCEEHWTEDGEELPEVKFCSHVEQRHATFADVHVRERLEMLVVEILGLVDRPATEIAVDVRETIHGAIYSLCASGENVDVDETREPYKTIVAEQLAEIRKGAAA